MKSKAPFASRPARKNLSLALVASAVSVLCAAQSAHAADAAPTASAKCDPYQNYSCLDSYLGNGFWERLGNYYELEWGKDGAPADDKAPPGRRENFPPQAQPAPPMPFTEWPYGGGELLGATRTGSIDSPLMVALGNTSVGQWMNEKGFQTYGWVNVGGNVSTNDNRSGGNWPAAYFYNPNTVQLDQVVMYLDRFPDTVQKENIDWGIRFSAIYGENYRYTTEYGYMSKQMLSSNHNMGFDSPMIYAEWFFPKIAAEGTEIRVGRYIAIPDIEAQLAPNNYMYSHSMTYGFDNYTNEGVIAISGIDKNNFLTYGVEIGTDTAFYHMNQTLNNPYPGSQNPFYQGRTMPVDPGAVPSLVASWRWQSDDAKDDISVTVNGWNHAKWGYNNQQWAGFTYYHVFNDKWHLAYEAYHEGERGVPNQNNTSLMSGYAGNGGSQWTTPFASMLNGPNFAQCASSTANACNSNLYATVLYINYSPDHLNNFSIRPEIFDDVQGQRSGNAGIYKNFALGWQHWFSPQLEVRPEINWMNFSKNSNNHGLGLAQGYGFNANSTFGGLAGGSGGKDHAMIVAGDVIFHF